MPILGLGKKPEEQKIVDVPDELPDLPINSESQTESYQETVSDDLAPDELPPIDEQLVVPVSEPAIIPQDDRRLYFSTMLQKIHEEGLKSTKLLNPSVNLLSDMKKNWKQLKKEQEINSMKEKLVGSINPLQQLEKEWISLQEEIEQKKRLLQEKEEAIQKLAEEAKQLAAKTEKMKSVDV